ncbi:MAG: sulfatase-like hydrolase/transferase [Planctomycetota bacterium]|jgi:N-acetylgalactosamine-6-sulfatase|nr:sulfatase-like hydrolase/transferase [Planctomycetota bacterium]
MKNSIPPRPPNVLFILADDWGYGDLGCYGNEQIQTPCLDRLAEQGTRFTRFYVASCVCSPSRCSFVTGHYPGRWQVHAHFARYDSNERRNMPHWLDIKSPSLPRLMQQGGYRTAHYGKWHLGGGGGIHGHPDAPFVKEYGYDDTRTWNGNGPTWYETTPWPFTLFNDSDAVWAANSSRMVVDATIDFIRQESEKPFFINLWLKDPHTPLHPTEEQREPFKHLPEPQQTYYSVIHSADRHIGRLMDALDELGLADNTLVIFSSDNGPEKVMLEHGTFGSPGNLRGRKHVLFDGGVRVPFIVRWPGHTPAGHVIDDTWISAVDMVPTFLDVAGIPTPRDWNPDGVSALSALHGQEFKRDKPMMWEWRNANCTGNDETIDNWPMLGIRQEEYMLLMNPVSGLCALYDTFDDEAQTRNLASDRPGLTRSLAGQIEDYSRSLPGYPTRPGAAAEN